MRVVVFASCLLPLAATARAQPTPVDPGPLIDRLAIDQPLIERVARGTLRRARRAIALGPTVGGYAAYAPDAGELDAAITFGLGLELFAIPVLPTPDNLRAIAIERAKARLRDRLIGGGDPQALAREVWHDVVEEVLGMEGIRAATVEKPRLTVALEGNRFLDAGVWAVRLRAGIGVWKLTLAGSLATAFTDPETSVYTGLEVVGHAMTSKRPRASVVDVFVRGDFEVRHRGTANADLVVVGVRYLLDAL